MKIILRNNKTSLYHLQKVNIPHIQHVRTCRSLFIHRRFTAAES